MTSKEPDTRRYDYVSYARAKGVKITASVVNIHMDELEVAKLVKTFARSKGTIRLKVFFKKEPPQLIVFQEP